MTRVPDKRPLRIFISYSGALLSAASSAIDEEIGKQTEKQSHLTAKLFVRLLAMRMPRGPNTIETAPGTTQDHIARFLFSRKTYETVLKPAIAEMQHEYFEALSRGEQHRARWIKWRGITCFWGTMVMQMPVSLTRVVVNLWKAAS